MYKKIKMILKAITLLSLAMCVLGDGHAISEQKIVRHYHHGKLDHIGHKVPEHHEEYAPSYPSYEFSYKVEDPHTHDMKGQSEHRDGDKVIGEYWLYQPDGRKRTVKYTADKEHGFKATVEFSDPHHHVHVKTHKHEEHEEKKPEEHVEHKHVEHKHVEHKHVEHKHVEHKHEEHKPVEHKHDDHKIVEDWHKEEKAVEHKISDHWPKIIEVYEKPKSEHEEPPKHIPALSLHSPRYHKYERDGYYHPRNYRHRNYE